MSDWGLSDRDGGGAHTERGSFSTLDGRTNHSAGGAAPLSDRTLEKINNLTIYIEPGRDLGCYGLSLRI